MVQALPSSNCSSRSCTPPTTGGHPLLNGFKHSRRLSTNTLDQYSPLSEDHRKLSLSSAIQKTKEGLGNMFADDEQSPEELIYNLFKVPNKSDAFIGKLIMVLKNHGLQENDPRLAPMMRRIREIESEKEEKSNEARDPKHWKLSKNDFKRVISESMSLIVQTMQGDLIVPAWGQFTNIIRDIFEECALISDGKVADYIPQLARMLPDQWGVTICTVDGQRHAFGDSNIPFCVQSVSKAFNYSIAASELGAEYVHQYVGQEPSGRLFNEICLDSNNKPHNPMVNSGAIIVTSLVQNKLNIADRFEHMLNQYRKIAGGEYVGFNNAMFLSEANTADRNFALAYFMKENGCFPPETTSLREALDFYFQLCSLEVTCEGMAVMAATLANGGVCPLTGERCIGSRPCRDVLSLMNSCGMYDYSGQFAFHVGLPAKSGVSGVMIVVVPNLMGIALWSPPLDKLGNSVRGVEFCKRLVQRFNFHNYDSLVHNESPKFDPRHRLGERERAAVVSLLFAAKAGDLNTIRRMYMQSVDLEMADYDKRTALHLAASEGHFDVALFLLETGRVKADPRDRWNRTPLDDAREARHTSVALLLERRVQELEQAKSIPAGRPLSLAAKCSSLQLLPSQKPIAESPSTGSLNQALEIETADAQNDLSSERSTGLHEKRKLALSPLTHSFSAANSPQNVGDGHRPLMDSGLCTSVESNISPLPQNEASQNQRPNLLPLPFRDELESSGTMPYREPNHHHQQQQQQHAEENQQHRSEHSPDEEQRIPNGSSHSAVANGRGGHNNNWGSDSTVEQNGPNATSAGVTDRPPFFCSDPSRNEMAQNKPHFELGDGQYYSSVDYSPSECRERLFSNGMRFWEEEKERMEEQATGATTLSLSRRRPEMGQQLSRTTGHSGSTSESEEEEEEDILANRDVRHRTAAPTKMSARSRGQQPDYHGHHRLANQRIEQLKQHHMI